MNRVSNRSYFFDQGIRFECQRCGVCCTGEPGVIFVDKHEVERIAEYVSIEVPRFVQQCLFPFRDGYSIREHSDGRCLYYKDGCTIYSVRPSQCSTYPFWFENMRSEKKWRRLAKECPGIGCGPLYSKKQIIEIIQSNMEAVIKPLIECKQNRERS